MRRREIGSGLLLALLGIAAACADDAAPAAGRMEIPVLQWGDSQRADGTTRHWNPQPLIDLKATLVCVAYRPSDEKGGRWHSVGMAPPKLLAKTLLNTRPELDECHRHGIRVIGYADSIMFHEDMLKAEDIDAADLYAVDRKGERVFNILWDKSGAGVSCVGNPRWVELQKRIATVTAEAGFDGLQFDVYPYAIDPGYLCCCRWCREDWGRHSQALFGASQPMPGLDSGKLDFRKPVDRAFKVWRLQKFVDFVSAVETSVRKSYPNFLLIMNHGGGTPDFTYEAVNGALRCPSTELWHLKLGDDPSLYLYSSAEAANGAKMIGLINFADQYKPDYRYRIALAEAYAGGGTFYAVTGQDDGGAGKISHAYCDFLRQQQAWFNGTQSAVEVAVLYSWRDQAFVQGDPVTVAKVEFDRKRDHYQRAAAVLSRMGVPHDCVIVEKGLSLRELSRYRVIVAPGLRLVTEKDAAVLEGYVRDGGNLLAIGEMGGVTESGQDFKDRDKSLLTMWTGKSAAGGGTATLGKGRIAFAASATQAEDTVALTPEFRSACESVELSSQLRIQSATPMESTIRAQDLKRSIHLIRFGSTDNLADRAVTVDYALPESRRAVQVSVWSPDVPASSMPFTWEEKGGRLQVRIGRVDSYALLGVVLRPGDKD